MSLFKCDTTELSIWELKVLLTQFPSVCLFDMEYAYSKDVCHACGSNPHERDVVL